MDGDSVDDPVVTPAQPEASAPAGPEPGAGDQSHLPEAVLGARSSPVDHGVIRALAVGAPTGEVVEQAAGAISALCPDRGVAVWYRRPDGTPTVQAAGVGAHLVVITGDPDSGFWGRARAEQRPNYRIAFRAHPDDIDPISVWCIPLTDGPVAGDLTLVVVGADDGTAPHREAQTAMEDITRLVGVGLDRHRLIERLEDTHERDDGHGPTLEMGIVSTGGDGEEPEATTLLYLGLAEIGELRAIHGRPATEEIIHEVGRRLSKTVRPGDTIARISDTDFVLRCYRVNGIESEAIVARLLTDLKEPVLSQSGARMEKTHLTPRIGLARAATSTPLSRLLKDAETAMRNADSVDRYWLWDTDDVDRKPRELAAAPVESGFGAGPQPTGAP